jgi:hypothetical protein
VERTFQRPAGLHQLVEYVEIAFGFAPHYDSTLLKQIPVDICTSNASIGREADANELSKPTRIVVSLRLSVTKCF